MDKNLESYKEIKRNLKETFGKEKSDKNIKEDKDILFCTKCGAEMDQDDLFCQSCGAKRKKEKVQSKNKEEQDAKVEEEIKQTKKALICKALVFLWSPYGSGKATIISNKL